jgi:hypothetical protein
MFEFIMAVMLSFIQSTVQPKPSVAPVLSTPVSAPFHRLDNRISF